MMIRVLIADDHPVVREGLKNIIEEIPDMAVADEASTGTEVIDKVCKNKYDVVVMDISMPGRDGLETLKRVKRENPKLPVLILSIHPESEYAARTLRAGASGYLTKERAADELIAAILKVHQGRKYVSSTFAEELASELESKFERPLHKKLSDREFQVMSRIAEGKTIKEIASELFLSPKTISTYRTRTLAKMNMKTNTELVRYAIKYNLVD